KYKVILTQDGEWEIGTIEVIPVCPVKEISMLDTVEAEGTVTITGKGFASTAKLALQEGEETPMEIEADVTADEMTFKVPASFLGDYKVILIQDGEWNIGTITVIPAARELRVKQIIANDGYSAITYQFTYDEQNRISNITSIQEEEAPMSYDFSYEENRIVVSGSKNYSYELTDGKVTTTIDEDSDKEQWEYTDNYFAEGAYGEFLCTWNDANNLATLYSEYAYWDANAVFGNLELKNNAGVVDMLPVIYSCSGYYWYDYDLIAFMLGVCGNRSTNLPTEITNVATEDELHGITYTMDSENPDYFSEAKWSYKNWEDETVNISIKVIYE
ncbi:MAG: hypothetical protein K2I90_00355, partial [Odoribacter sp.]|nr:hypothetical protein [Odoribacter sp.]